MAACAYCGAEAQQYNNGVPICAGCSNERADKTSKKPPASSGSIRNILAAEIVEATADLNRASREFFEVMGHIPTGFPHPDGSQHIHKASRDLSAARKNLMRAHTRLDDFLKTGNVPEDLKRSG